MTNKASKKAILRQYFINIYTAYFWVHTMCLRTLHDMVVNMQRACRARLINPWYHKEGYWRFFLPAAIRLYNALQLGSSLEATRNHIHHYFYNFPSGDQNVHR